MKLAEDFFTLQVQVVKFNALNELEFTNSFPGQLAPLISDEPRLIEQGLRAAERAWLVLQAAESRRHASPRVAQLLDQVLWTRCTSVREVLVACAEYGFKHVPGSALAALTCCFKSFGHEAVVENGFKVVAEDAKSVPSKKTSRQRRFMTAVGGEVFQRYGREKLPVPAASAARVSQAIPASAFEACAGKTAVDPALLEEVTGKRSWKGLSGVSCQDIPLSWNLLGWALDTGRWNELQKSWKALLFLEGSTIVHTATGQVKTVLAARPRGILVWPMIQRHLEKGHEHFEAAEKYPEMHVVTSWDEWSVVPSLPLPPVVVHHECRLRDAPVGILVMRSGSDRPVLEHAAWNGFAGVPANAIDRLLVDFRVPACDRPKQLLDRIVMLVKRIIPAEVTTKQLADILKRRAGLHRQRQESASFDAENREHTEATLDPDDRGKGKKCVDEDEVSTSLEQCQVLQFLKEKKWSSKKDDEALDMMLSNEKVAAARAAKEKALQAPVAKRIVISWTPDEVKKLRPRVAGCWIQRYPHLRRWQVYYQAASPFKSFSRKWGGKVTEKEVTVAVLKWAWQWHTATTGEACPWQLSV